MSEVLISRSSKHTKDTIDQKNEKKLVENFQRVQLRCFLSTLPNPWIIDCIVLYSRSRHNHFLSAKSKFSATSLHVPEVMERENLQLQLYSEWSVRELSFGIRTYFVGEFWFSHRRHSFLIIVFL